MPFLTRVRRANSERTGQNPRWIRWAAIATIAFLLLAGGEPAAAFKEAIPSANGTAAPVQGGKLDAIVNSASYALPPVAPDSIASAFGVSFSSATEVNSGGTLPTTLAGTRVEINGQAAGLFFVSPTQINLHIPASIAAGTATVVVRNPSNAIVAQGTVSVKNAAPGIFTANASGKGLPAATILRRSAGGERYEFVSQFDPATGMIRPKPIELGIEGESVYLILYLTGIRRANPSDVRVLIGGQSLKPLYSGPAPGFVGLDQVNVELPAELKNRGLVSLLVTAPDAEPSNSVDLEFARTSGLRITGFAPGRVAAGDVMEILGDGFATAKEKNLVRILGSNIQSDGLVVNAQEKRLSVLVPFGVQKGKVSVTNLSGAVTAGTSETDLAVKTSVSGFIKDTDGRKLKGIKVKVRDAAGNVKMTETNVEGVFVVADLAAGPAELEFDARSSQPSYDVIRFKQEIAADRDNPVNFPTTMQAIDGVSTNLGAAGNSVERQLKLDLNATPQEPAERIIKGNVILDIPDNAVIRFPDGTPAGRVTLTLVKRSLTPVALPQRHFSSTIAMITPIGATITPGAKFTFPNADGFPAGSKVKLFRLEQIENAKLGLWVESGMATVSNDGQRIETDAGAVTQTTYHFVSTERPVVTVVGKVFDYDDIPVRGSLTGSRGQPAFTDGTGSYFLRNVPLNSPGAFVADGAIVHADRNGRAIVGADVISVEANLVRATRTLSRGENNDVIPGGDVIVPADIIKLDRPGNTPPEITGLPSSATLNAGQTQMFEIGIRKGNGAEKLEKLEITGVSFATLTAMGNDVYKLTLSPGPNDRGAHTLVIIAINDLSGQTTAEMKITVN